MFTPQEVQNQKFEKAVFGGYDMAAVDEFLEQLTVDYATLYKENAVLKNKLKVLVESLEEYRSVDDSMRKALLSAQKMAAQTVEDAKAQAAEIIAEAEGSAATRKKEAELEAAAEEKRLAEVKANAAAFLAGLKEHYRKQLEALERVPELKVEDVSEPEAPAAAPVEETAAEIGNIIAMKLQEEEAAQPEEAQAEESVDLEATKTRIDFGTLQFGDSYGKQD